MASFRVPYWTAFAATAALAPLGIASICLWIDDLAHLTGSGSSLALVVGQLAIISMAGLLAAIRFEYLTLYHLELDAAGITGRSTLKSWRLSFSDVDAIVPGWRRPWWRADFSRYVVRLANGDHLFIWRAKGLAQFLDCIGTVEPRLRLSDECRSSSVERSRGKSGFSRNLSTGEMEPDS